MQPSNDPFLAPVTGLAIAFITHEYAPFRGGAATYVRETANAMQHLGKPVRIWTVDYGGKVSPDESFGTIPVVRLSSSGRLTPRGLLGLAWGLWRRREELRGVPVVLMSVGAQMAFFLLLGVGARPGGRVTCVFYGSEVLRFSRNPFWGWLARRFYRQPSVGFAVITPYVENLLQRSRLLPESNQITLASCALPTTFHVEQTAPVAPDAKPYRILTVARLHPRKGQLEVARALASLPELWRERIVYQVVGTGDENYRQQIETACREGGVPCEFPGAVDDTALARFYASATIYAQASRTLPQSVEGFGMTFLEAGVHGCPVAAWRSGGVASAVLDGKTGLLVEEGDITGLASAIESLLTDPPLRVTMGAAGKLHAQSFSWEKTAQSLYSTATCD